MMHVKKILLIVGLILIVFAGSGLAQETTTWPNRVLITNDNGIEDVKIVALAKAFSKIAETIVIAPKVDRSGATTYMPTIRTGRIQAEMRDIGEGIEAYAVDGFPAECVILGLLGMMSDRMPDLVVSGINGGANLGKDWLGSGTIGAARIAAYAGIPAIAVSGLDDDMPEAVAAANEWVVKLAQSPVVRELKQFQYLTVSMPRLLPTEIKGIRVAPRSYGTDIPVFSRVETEEAENQIWQITGTTNFTEPAENTDEALHRDGYIVVVPMRADEHDYEMLKRLQTGTDLLPGWK